ncbi:MAG: hypothetical protein HFI76_07585 [Lachnospiraceae bacterium]|jgi:leader peptidase (prepilin peptidase)/N-methyltransferase|nr:hypothetical protein [Lachnospiraceae bacterium]
MEQGILLGMLGVCAAEDIKKRSIPLPYLVIFGLVGIGLHWYGHKLFLFDMGTGIAVGVGLLGLSALTRGSIGMGDGFIFCAAGIFLGGSGNVELLMFSLMYAGIWSLGMIVFKKRKSKVGKQRIPFAPFVFIGYVTMLVGKVL